MKAFSKFIGYIILKWVLFYVYQFVEGGDSWSFEKTNGEGLFLAAFMLLGLPLLEIAILFFPMQLALRTKGWKTILLLLAVFGLEFLLGWYATNQHLEVWMIVKIVLSLGLFLLFYRKQLLAKKLLRSSTE